MRAFIACARSLLNGLALPPLPVLLQDTRFANKQKKMMANMTFPEEYKLTVTITRPALRLAQRWCRLT
jgi:hypothetical protein